MANNAAGIRRAFYRAIVVGIVKLIHSISRANNCAILDIAGKAANVFSAGDVAKVVHILQRAVRIEHSCNTADMCPRLDSICPLAVNRCIIGRV